ncbi:hypothetical protein N0V85_007201 [Neurospora sp. IMI 360204]|nr:hypothetical protein N0V85_007201 [Neurospora sp. IMI 360204]
MDPYTAGALASVAFGRAEPMVDENVTRVLARQLGIRGDVRTKEVEGVIQEAARRLVEQVAWDGVEAKEEAETKKKLKAKAKRRKTSSDEGGGEPAVMAADRDIKNRRRPRLSSRPGPWGQALMELGASICLPAPATPRCHSCPIQGTCRAYAEGLEIAREKLVVALNPNTKKEKTRVALKKKVEEDLREQKMVIKEETQDEADTGHGDVHYLGTVPKTPQPQPQPLPSTNKKTQQRNKDENTTISATFYEQDKYPSYSRLREYVNNPGKTKPKGTKPSAAAQQFITSYCAQYPYTKPKAKPWFQKRSRR